jgi:hypothetical protein
MFLRSPTADLSSAACPGRLRAEADALQIDLKTRVESISIERFDAEGVKSREESHVRLLAQCVAKRERAMRRQFGHQAVRQWL